MAQATRLGDLDTGHDACPATALQEGSPTVFINGLAAGRIGDSVSCGGTVAEGSSDVWIGD